MRFYLGGMKSVTHDKIAKIPSCEETGKLDFAKG